MSDFTSAALGFPTVLFTFSLVVVIARERETDLSRIAKDKELEAEKRTSPRRSASASLWTGRSPRSRPSGASASPSRPSAPSGRTAPRPPPPPSTP
ncbi:hypothetical protein GCM10022205_46030 [Spinactinospora alkalitolerans]